MKTLAMTLVRNGLQARVPHPNVAKIDRLPTSLLSCDVRACPERSRRGADFDGRPKSGCLISRVLCKKWASRRGRTQDEFTRPRLRNRPVLWQSRRQFTFPQPDCDGLPCPPLAESPIITQHGKWKRESSLQRHRPRPTRKSFIVRSLPPNSFALRNLRTKIR